MYISADVISLIIKRWLQDWDFFNASAAIHSSTHWGRLKMAVNLEMTFSKCIFNENIWVSNKISLMFVCHGPVDN